MKKTILFALALSTVIISCENKKGESTATTSTVTAPAAPTIDTLCFIYVVNKVDSTSVQLVIKGDSISGNMHWHPYEKDGAHGTLKGVKKGDTITADYNYMIEGSNQVEEVVFKLTGDKLSKLNGELEEKNGKLVLKDPSKAKADEVYTKTDCSKVLDDNEK